MSQDAIEEPTPAAARPGKSARTRSALRDAALRHFIAHGVDGASVPAIAAEVGVTERTFYRHFATKDEVLFGDLVSRLAWFHRGMRERPVEEDLVRSVLIALGAAPIDPRLMIEIARLRSELLSPDRPWLDEFLDKGWVKRQVIFVPRDEQGPGEDAE